MPLNRYLQVKKARKGHIFYLAVVMDGGRNGSNILYPLAMGPLNFGRPIRKSNLFDIFPSIPFLSVPSVPNPFHKLDLLVVPIIDARYLMLLYF